MAEATMYQDGCAIDYTAPEAVTGGEVTQLWDGRAAVLPVDLASGKLGAAQVAGIYKVTKANNLVFVNGCEVYWDHSANEAILYPASDRDFFLGVCIGDVAATTLEAKVALNIRPQWKIDLNHGGIGDEFQTTIVKTVVGSTTVEVPHVRRMGGTHAMILGATAEAQKLDLISQQGFAVGSNWIMEGGFNIIDDGDAAAIDFNIGVANATHASDADAIAESCFLHLDGNDLNLHAESDDGTTEVAATDTTTDIALGTPVHFVIDGRDPADIQIYVNGVLQLGSTTFTLAAATGPLKLLAHLEKTADDTTADYRINYLRVRTMQRD